MNSTRASILALSFCTLATVAGAQANTDVYLLRLPATRGEPLAAPMNLTSRVGYDNQPAFTADGKSLLFTSTREDAQADIWRVDLATKATTRVTTTAPVSEYSATLTPDGKGFSMIRVEKDSTQRLWRTGFDGTGDALVFERIKPVGYHAWVDDHTLALFVLGNPASLQVADTKTGEGRVVAHNIGRSLLRVPGSRRRISYVQLDSARGAWLTSLDLDATNAAPVTLVAMAPGADYVTWTSADHALSLSGNTLLEWSTGDAQWRPVGTIAGVQKASRLTVSPDGKWLAFVAEPLP
ncbi:MAG: hypothetical protein JWO05_3107 [Gemmatimonadetes bacterium]|nr:hypothetical protein [Gemmatimonadota bacterium]